MSNIITDAKQLNIVCEPVLDINEAKDIANKLFEILSKSKNGIGLAANQIGIFKRICVVNTSRPLWFMNPRFIGGFEKIMLNEKCLSFPGKTVNTMRYKNIIVAADNFECDHLFGPAEYGSHGSAWESVCIQHEICHLNGEAMFDYEIKNE